MSTAIKQLDLPAPQVPQPTSETGAVLAIIERAARDPSVDIGKMRELLTMRNEMMAFEAKRDFQAAMNAAQTEMLPVAVNANNPQTKSRYATFEALDGALRPIYTKHGFSLSFGTGEGAPPEHVRITCRVSHRAGHVETPHLDMPADGKGAKGGDVMTKTHATGAAITYGRRYLEGMIFNIAISRDDDGNGAKLPPGGTKTIDDAQYRYLADLIEKAAASEEKMLAYCKVEKLEDFTQKDFKWAEAMLRKRLAEGKGKPT